MKSGPDTVRRKEEKNMNRAELKKKAKLQMKAPFWTLVVILIIHVLLCCIPYVSLVITPALTLGLSIVFLKVARGEKLEISNLFDGFSKLGRALWLNILQNLFITLWSLLFVIPGIIKGYSYAMSFYVLADHPEMTAREALKESQRIMDGHKMELFELSLSFIGWLLLSYVTFGLSLVYVLPYMNTTMANFYESIKRPEVVSSSYEGNYETYSY